MIYQLRFILSRSKLFAWVLFLLLSSYQNAFAESIATVIFAQGEVYALTDKNEKETCKKDRR
jgi:hypothetical protein